MRAINRKVLNQYSLSHQFYAAPFATLVYTRMSIELQNSTIFFVFLSLVEITYRYGIIQTGL